MGKQEIVIGFRGYRLIYSPSFGAIFQKTRGVFLRGGGGVKIILKLFWPTSVWMSQFMAKYNLKYRTETEIFYSETGLLCQLVPVLQFTHAARKFFKIPALQGRILNYDESHTYVYDTSSKFWSF